MNTTDNYDFVIIGGGSAGYNAAATAVRLGLKTAVVEGAETLGGLCILRGCMPSKAFLESAHRAENVRRAGEFGVRAKYLGADGPAIQARKRALVDDFAAFRRSQLEAGKFALIRGQASFVGPHTVEVRDGEGASRRVEGRTFLIATGSRLHMVDLPGLKETGALTSDEVLDSEKIPESVVILGGGATGLEFASYYRGLGVEVTVLQRSGQLLREMDADIAQALSAALIRRGIHVVTGTKLRSLEKAGNRKRVHFEHLGEARVVEAEEIIYALGRSPNTAGLALEKAGVELAADGTVCVRPSQQTSAPHIFAAGDVCGPYEVVHIAIQQGDVAARNAARLVRGDGGELETIDYTLKLFAVFTQPQAAAVGLTLREALERGLEVVEACYSFDEHGKSLVQGETDGFVKLIVLQESKKIIGAALLGPEAAELIHEIVVAMAFGATAAQLAAVPHYHPTLSEIWTYPAEALAEA